MPWLEPTVSAVVAVTRTIKSTEFSSILRDFERLLKMPLMIVEPLATLDT